MENCIRMGITVLKIVIWLVKLLILWLEFVFYSFADTLFPNLKTNDLPAQMTILKTVIP